jgi:hypothetical protein
LQEPRSGSEQVRPIGRTPSYLTDVAREGAGGFVAPRLFNQEPRGGVRDSLPPKPTPRGRSGELDRAHNPRPSYIVDGYCEICFEFLPGGGEDGTEFRRFCDRHARDIGDQAWQDHKEREMGWQ